MSFFGSLAVRLAAEPAVVTVGVGVLSVALAGAAYHGLALIACGSAAIIAINGAIADRIGQRLVRSKPQTALALIEAGVLAPLAIAAGLSGLVTLIGVGYDAEGVAPGDRALVTAFLAALGASLGVAFIRHLDDPDNGWIGERTRTAFEREYVGVFPPESRAAKAVFSDPFEGCHGWSWRERAHRVAAVSEALADTTT